MFHFGCYHSFYNVRCSCFKFPEKFGKILEKKPYFPRDPENMEKLEKIKTVYIRKKNFI